MAGFHTHIATSTVLGVGYAGAGALAGAPLDLCLVAGGLCGVSGMLPDIDSDRGIPIRESMAFAAAVVPMLLVERFAALGLGYETMVLVAGALYLLIRFGLAKVLRKFTVHRGMFHSIPAAIIFAELAFLITGSPDLESRYYKAFGVLLGVLSHLFLDEFYSIEFKGGRVRLKRSFGTAAKFWGRSIRANLVAYLLLAVVTAALLGEPMLMEHLGVPPHDSIYHTANQAFTRIIR